MVCDGVFLNDVHNCKFIYTHGDECALRTTVRLQHVVDANIEMVPITGKEDLPFRFRKLYRSIYKLEALLMSEDTHDSILEEIERKNNFDM